jgi:hypothetical protein
MVISENQRKRNMRQLRPGLRPIVNGNRYAILDAIRNRRLTHNDMASYTPCMSLQRETLESFLRDINLDFQAQLDARMEVIKKEIEVERRKAIERLYKVWPQMGGAKNDLDVLAAELQLPAEETNLETRSNGNRSHKQEGGDRTIPMSDVRRVVQEAIASIEYDAEITQTDIKDRILSEYPDAKVPSVRAAISRLLKDRLKRGELEIVEEGKAGSPNRYRKKKTEGNLLDS